MSLLPAPPNARCKHPGVGVYMTFRCAACAKVKGVVGRKLKRVMGLRQYVCAGCNEKWLAP